MSLEDAPGIPGVRQGGGAGDPGSGARGPQRGTMGAPRHEGAHDPAGQGAAPVTRQAREEGLDLLLQQPFCGLRDIPSSVSRDPSMIMIPTDRPVRSVERKRLTICLRIPPLSTHKGRRESLGILMPETGDGTQELPQKPTPVSTKGRRGRAGRSDAPCEQRLNVVTLQARRDSGRIR